jgi:DNA polymerase III delta prime subunit
MGNFVFGRDKEQHALNQHVLKNKPFLLHGPTGVGKTLLLRSLLEQMPAVLYCETSASAQVVFRSWPAAYWRKAPHVSNESAATSMGSRQNP